MRLAAAPPDGQRPHALTGRPPGWPGVVPSRVAMRLTWVVAVLGTLAAGVGVLSGGGTTPGSVTSVHGELVELYGSGVYRFDSVFKGAGNRGSDLVTLVVGLPSLVVAGVLYRRGSLRGSLVLSGVLGWFLYLYATMSVGAAYNELFLVYVALLGCSLAAFGTVLASIDSRTVLERLGPLAPRRRLAALLFAAGAVTSVVWLGPLLGAALAGEPPELLAHSTTMVTDALDLAIVTPATFLAGHLVRRGSSAGYVLACPLLVVLTILLPVIVAQTAYQLDAGLTFTPPQIIGPITGFLVLGGLATGALVGVLRPLGSVAVAVRSDAPPRS